MSYTGVLVSGFDGVGLASAFPTLPEYVVPQFAFVFSFGPIHAQRAGLIIRNRLVI